MPTAQYESMHAKRFEYLEKLVKRLRPEKENHILDIGPSVFTLNLSTYYKSVSALGRGHTKWFDKSSEGSSLEQFFEFDLNRTLFEDMWLDLPAHDVIIFAEVIEHLFVPAEAVLRFLATALAPGGTLIVQTPNATSLEKRGRMLLGYPPFDRVSAGHFRELTKEELIKAGEVAGLRCVMHEYRDYFGVRGNLLRRIAGESLHLVCRPFPSLRRGQTVVFRS